MEELTLSQKNVLKNIGKFMPNDPSMLPNLLNQFRTLNPSKFQSQLQEELNNPLTGYLDNDDLNQFLQQETSQSPPTVAAILVRNSPHRISPQIMDGMAIHSGSNFRDNQHSFTNLKFQETFSAVVNENQHKKKTSGASQEQTNNEEQAKKKKPFSIKKPPQGATNPNVSLSIAHINQNESQNQANTSSKVNNAKLRGATQTDVQFYSPKNNYGQHINSILTQAHNPKQNISSKENSKDDVLGGTKHIHINYNKEINLGIFNSGLQYQSTFKAKSPPKDNQAQQIIVDDSSYQSSEKRIIMGTTQERHMAGKYGSSSKSPLNGRDISPKTSNPNELVSQGQFSAGQQTVKTFFIPVVTLSESGTTPFKSDTILNSPEFRSKDEAIPSLMSDIKQFSIEEDEFNKRKESINYEFNKMRKTLGQVPQSHENPHRDSHTKYLKKKTPSKQIEIIQSFGLPPQHPRESRQQYVDNHPAKGRINNYNISVSDSNSDASTVMLKPMSQLANRSQPLGNFPSMGSTPNYKSMNMISSPPATAQGNQKTEIGITKGNFVLQQGSNTSLPPLNSTTNGHPNTRNQCFPYFGVAKKYALSEEPPGRRKEREVKERKESNLKAVKIMQAKHQEKKKDNEFVAQFLQKKNSMTKNINMAMHQIKSQLGGDELKRQVTDIKADLEEGTRLALKNRVKSVSKEYHIHEPLKLTMNELFEKKPLIIRREFQIPNFQKPDFSKTVNSDLNGFKSYTSNLRRITTMDLNNESREGLVTETQLEIISGHVANIDRGPRSREVENEERRKTSVKKAQNFIPGRRVVVPTQDMNNSINSRYSQEDSAFETLVPEKTPETVQALLPQPMPEIFINDEDIIESQKGNSSMVSLTRSAEYGRISQYNSKTKQEAIDEQASENSGDRFENKKKKEDALNRSKEGRKRLQDIGFDSQEMQQTQGQQYTDREPDQQHSESYRQSRLTFANLQPEKSIPKPPLNRGFPKGKIKKMGALSGTRKMLQTSTANPGVAPWSQSIDSQSPPNKSLEKIPKESSLPPMRHGKVENQSYYSHQSYKPSSKSPKNLSFRKGTTVKQAQLQQFASTQIGQAFKLNHLNEQGSPLVQMKSTFHHHQIKKSSQNQFVSFNNQDIAQSLNNASSEQLHSLTDDHPYLTYSIQKKQRRNQLRDQGTGRLDEEDQYVQIKASIIKQSIDQNNHSPKDSVYL